MVSVKREPRDTLESGAEGEGIDRNAPVVIVFDSEHGVLGKREDCL